MSNNLSNLAMQLSVGNTLSGSWFANAVMNQVWTDVMRSSLNGLMRNAGRADLLGEALGGGLRGDAAMLRQASANVSEARSMMDMAASAAGSISDQLREAQKLAGDYLALGAADPQRAVLSAQYDAIRKNIDSTIKNTRYNGIALLDGSAWGGDGRLSVTPGAGGNAAAASVHIQAGESGFPLLFNNMAPEFSTTDLALTSPDVMTNLSGLQQAAQSLADWYAGRAGSLQSQAASLHSQADILTEAAAQRIKTPPKVDTKSLLLGLVLRESGGIFSGKG
jgi:flagellin